MVPAGYFELLGRFTHAYSTAESVLHLSFHKFTGLELEMAHIIKDRLGAGKLMGVVKEIMPFTELEEKDQATVVECIQQLEHITAFRHRVIHRGARATDDGKLVATNLPSMKSMEGFETTTFTLLDIKNAIEDLDCLTLKLVRISLIESGESSNPAIEAALLAPWRYKPVQVQKPNLPPRPPKPQTPKHRPPASQK